MEGEILQLANQNQLINEAQYTDVIYRKTAILFASACQCAAILAQQPPAIQQHCFDYGKALGLAFQVVDDILDYNTDSATLGKQQGNDIQEGKMTLPLIYFLQTATPEQQQRVEQAIQQPTEQTQDIINWVNQSEALNQCRTVAKQYQQQAALAIQILPDTPFKQALIQLSQYAIKRVC